MTLFEGQLIGQTRSCAGDRRFRANDAATGKPRDPEFVEATDAEIHRVAELAWVAFLEYRKVPNAERARFLDAIAAGLEAAGDPLLELASAETALPLARLTGERGRTCFQLRLFSSLLITDEWQERKYDAPDPERKPAPKPELHSMLIPIGPTAVFGSSNFPFAYSVAGGDTASALAAGCPVIVKAHPAHPGTSAWVAQIILDAARLTGMPDGVFSMVHGAVEVGSALVREPKVAGVGFTGSVRGGRALFDLAAARPVPIPVFAEMGSVNPSFLLPGALVERGQQIAEGYAASLVLGVGQFCTNPGLVIGLAGPDLSRFAESVATELRKTATTAMLTPAICHSYCHGVDRLAGDRDVTTLLRTDSHSPQAAPALFLTTAHPFLTRPELREEVFGPCGIVVACSSEAQMLQVAQDIEGQLTASVHFADSDADLASQLFGLLPLRAGRVIANGYPTGVEVSHAMCHGGPYPSSSDSRFTAVGPSAIRRWLRPVCWQNVPEQFLP